MEKGINKRAVIRIILITLLGAGLCLFVYYSPAIFIKDDKSSSAVHLKTGGTSVAFVIMQNRWRAAYLKEKGVEVDYQSSGSTKGIKQMLEGNYVIAFSHAPVSEKQRKEVQDEGKEVIHVPVVLCAVVPVYNVEQLKDKPPLRFTAEVLAKIFLGKIDKWNDPELKKLNQNVDLPDSKITVVHRNDSSGTTFIFADYLSRGSNTWRDKFGEASNVIAWPVGDAETRNEGVASHVRVTEGTIGYVDLLHAVNNKLQYGAVQNKDQTAFIHAKAENMTAAMKAMHAEIPEDLTFKLTNRPGKDSYPISGAIWAVCYQAQPASIEKEVVDFLHWATHEGQRFAPDMSYAPLPAELVERVDKKLKSIKVAL